MHPTSMTRYLTFACALLFAPWAVQATTLDLTTAGATGSLNGAVYTQVPAQSTGSGLIDSFVRVGAANQTLVQAYNTTASNPFDNVGGSVFNHDVTVGQVGSFPLGGTEILRFLLDINQTRQSPLLNLDEVQIFLSTTPNQSTSLFSGGLLALADAALVYQMDAGGDNTIMLNYALNPGSGAGDMTLDIAASALDPAFAALGLLTQAQKDGAYVYLYSRFGSSPNGNNDGFEEWAYDPPAAGSVPEPGTLALLALGLLLIVGIRPRYKSFTRRSAS